MAENISENSEPQPCLSESPAKSLNLGQDMPAPLTTAPSTSGKSKPTSSKKKTVSDRRLAQIFSLVESSTELEKRDFLEALTAKNRATGKNRIRFRFKGNYKWVSRNRQDGLGLIRVTHKGKVLKSRAATYADRFLGGDTGKLLELLTMVEPMMPEHCKKVALILQNEPKRKLSSVIAEAKSDFPSVSKWAIEAMKMQGDINLIVTVTENQDSVIKNIARIATSGQGLCRTCVGTGKVKNRAPDLNDTVTCPACDGSGKTAEHKDVLKAAELFAKIAKITPEASGTQINLSQTNQTLAIGDSAARSLIEQQSGMAERILNRKEVPLLAAPKQESILEAVLVEPELSIPKQ